MNHWPTLGSIGFVCLAVSITMTFGAIGLAIYGGVLILAEELIDHIEIRNQIKRSYPEGKQ